MLQTALTFHRYEDMPEVASSFVEISEPVHEKTSKRPDPGFMKDGVSGRGDNAPWHTYDKGLLEYDPPLYRIPVFSGSIHEMKTRLLTTPELDGPKGIDKSVPWRIALRMRTEFPP